MSISEFHNIANNAIQGAPGNPNGTTSATYVMCGLAISFTPKMTGRVKIKIGMNMSNSLANDFTSAIIAFGTGAAPVNGAAATGSAVGFAPLFQAYANGAQGPGMAFALISALTLGTTYWVDLQQKIVTGGTGTLTSLYYEIEEIQL